MKKKISLLLIALMAIVGLNINVKAEEGFYADESLALSSTIGTTTFAAGNNVNVSSNIDGISFVAGNIIRLSSTQDYMFAAGNDIQVNGATVKDAFIAGSNIIVENSTIRDLYVAGQTVKIDTEVSRNVFAGGDEVIITGKINGNVKVASDKITIGENAIIAGTLEYPEDAKISIGNTAQIAQQKTYKNVDKNITISKGTAIKTTITETLISFVSMLLIGAIILYLNKNIFKKFEEQEKNAESIIKNILKGLAFLIVLPLAAVILMITVIGIPLSIISLLVYGIMIYLSVLPTAYFFGKWILNNKITNDYLLLTVSLLVIYILRIVPVIGGLVTLVSLFYGLGVYYNLIKNKTKEK